MGSNSTGKTTLMWLVDFIFGCKNKEFIPAVEKNCSEVVVDLTINETKYTIIRNIANKNLIDVYENHYASIEELKSQESVKYGFKASNERPAISDFYLEKLDVIQREVPVTNTKTANFSWRNLVSLIYVPQDKWNGIQAENEFQPLMKKSVFEILLDINNDKIEELEFDIRKLNEFKEEQRTLLKTIEIILKKKDTLLGSDISLASLKGKIKELQQEKKELHNNLEVKKESEELVKEKNILQKEIFELNRNLHELNERLDELNMLKSENDLNLAKNRLLLKARKVFSEIPITKCPKCFNEVTDNNSSDNCSICGNEYQSVAVDQEYARNLFLLMDEQKEISKLLSSLQNEIEELDVKIKNMSKTKIDLENEITRINKEIIFPVLQKIENINSALNTHNKSLGEAEQINSLIKDLQYAKDAEKQAQEDIRTKQKELNEVKKEENFAVKVKDEFTTIFKSVLETVLFLPDKVKGLNELYLPEFEDNNPLNRIGKEDIDKSKAAKVVLAYYTTILEFALKYGGKHPKLLMLDTPRQDELDMSVFANILNYWDGLKKYKKEYQIIITGSEFPEASPIKELIIEKFHSQESSGDMSKPDRFSIM